MALEAILTFWEAVVFCHLTAQLSGEFTGYVFIFKIPLVPKLNPGRKVSVCVTDSSPWTWVQGPGWLIPCGPSASQGGAAGFMGQEDLLHSSGLEERPHLAHGALLALSCAGRPITDTGGGALPGTRRLGWGA